MRRRTFLKGFAAVMVIPFEKGAKLPVKPRPKPVKTRGPYTLAEFAQKYADTDGAKRFAKYAEQTTEASPLLGQIKFKEIK